MRSLPPLLVAAFVLSAVPVWGEEMPDDAARLIFAFEEDAEALRFEAERRIAEQRTSLARELKVLQDRYTRAAQLDEAVAIRDYIRAVAEDVLPAEPAPDNVLQLQGQVGRAFYFKVTGNLSGSLYGTDVYTGDSSIATAAVHAGILKHDETGVVKVRVLPGRASYATSQRHGITSSQWSSYPLSFSVEPVRNLVIENEATKPAAANPGLAPREPRPAQRPEETPATDPARDESGTLE
jgi:hypothetical protein